MKETLEPKTESKLKDAAKVFAKTVGSMIKAGGMFRFEDGETPDPLVAIKTTIKKGVSVELCKRELKKLGTPVELIDQMAKAYSDWFCKSIFGGDKKAIDNLLKTTEQFNYFANVVFGIWHRDQAISKLLKKTVKAEAPAEDTAAEDLEEREAFRASGTEDAEVDEADEKKPACDGEDGCVEDGELDEEDLAEGYDRYGGFGGYGRSYSSYGSSSAPRGASIGWYCVADVDPACKGMDRNWRFGPIEFTRGIVDFLYPERQYKRGATMLRHKHFKMPDDGDVVELYVGIASIFDAVKNNDEEALKKLDMLGINRNISLGLDPEDDYSSQYVLR